MIVLLSIGSLPLVFLLSVAMFNIEQSLGIVDGLLKVGFAIQNGGSPKDEEREESAMSEEANAMMADADEMQMPRDFMRAK